MVANPLKAQATNADALDLIDNTNTPIRTRDLYRYAGYIDIDSADPEDFVIGVLQKPISREDAVRKILLALHKILPLFNMRYIKDVDSVKQILSTYVASSVKKNVLAWYIIRNGKEFRIPHYRIGTIFFLKNNNWEVPVRIMFEQEKHIVLAFLFHFSGSKLFVEDITGDTLPEPYEGASFSPMQSVLKLGP